MSIEAMKQAYQILITEPHSPTACDKLEVILRQAIAEAEKQEPVMWVMPDGKTVDKWGLQFYGGQTGKPLYAHKREWVGLTDEEIDQGQKESWVTKQAWESAVWWAEAKLRERNT